MSISVENISFSYGEKSVFKDLSMEIGEGESPVVILGASGCGKTTLLRLMAGLLKPSSGAVESSDRASFVFQENRLLPWYTVLENVSLPIETLLGKPEAREKARQFLELVSLGDKANAFPTELSGGQAQRAAIARAFAYPSPLLFMDEPFQSLDIPLRLQLMDTVLALLEKEKRLTLLVTHDPREGIYLGRRILVLGAAPAGIILDEGVDFSREDRAYGAAAHSGLEKRLMDALRQGPIG
ncbi:aliphatic sulfonates import ATP-binding protein SsuB 1 [Treponema primitia ZAS-2]|uniref:Aliphatic sulfonates import ATP-binding protein SsuB 1 n=1 Tax=Treponema primitia (strain ATCC BAA-887 / DSM 12427 / ZAS-2) TaxID=545694 RepID=F5YGM7_TREPZ|nr:ABC transporter ATP-binding protein [Treponema primitia]AEF85281.1 aliphatic sulfonates import ATP-binding protein SsuB 1 [Treponema primitia ZAS-2]